MTTRKMTMGVIVGNRGFFPDALAKAGREEIIRTLGKAGMDCVVLGLDQSKFGADALKTFGGVGVVEIPRMQELLRFICDQGFEHHVAANLTQVSEAVHEAATRYLGWDMYWHRATA